MANILTYHPLYSQWQETWRRSLDVFEGAGGFLDPERPYLIAHPREWLDHTIKVQASGDSPASSRPNPNPTQPSPKLIMRRKLARYENVAETILHSVTGALFLQPPGRTFAHGQQDNQQVRDWWADVDGRGTQIDQFLQDSWVVSGAFGHSVLFMDKASMEPATAADAEMPRLYRYTPLDLIDWLTDEDGEIVAVKLLEPAPRMDFAKKLTTKDIRVRVVDEKQWTLYDGAGNIVKDADGKPQQADHGFGRLPVEILYAKRRPLTPVVGKAVMGDPQLHIDLYNLTSEVRELLRNQTFAILNVPIGKDGSVEKEQDMLGQQSGTGNIMFSTAAAQYISPQGDNVAAYHEHLDRLTRIIYRLAAVPWEGDSRAAESADSRRIKREDFNQVLSKYAAEIQRTDSNLLDLFYIATYGPAAWENQKAKDQPSISYPTSFEPPDLEAVAKRAAELLGLDLGPTATKELKKGVVRVALPDLPPAKQQAVDKEIDGQVIQTAHEKQQALLDSMKAKLGAQPNDTQVPGKPMSPNGQKPPVPPDAKPADGKAA